MFQGDAFLSGLEVFFCGRLLTVLGSLADSEWSTLQDDFISERNR